VIARAAERIVSRVAAESWAAGPTRLLGAIFAESGSDEALAALREAVAQRKRSTTP
jgi:hypothetical protein